jgi:hypothetical protein
MESRKNPTFITEYPLRVDAAQERVLLVRMDAARQIYNACLGESLKRLRLMRESRIYQAARKMRYCKQRSLAFRQAREAHGFREYDLHAYAVQFSHSWLGKHVDSSTTQKIASRAFGAAMMYALGKHGKPRFKGKNQLISVEGKSNKTGIRWQGDRVEWMKLVLPAIIDENDSVQIHGLQAPVKYVRLLSRNVGNRRRFYAQLVCEGEPYRKSKNTLGQGRVGLDVGPSTVAVVSENGARLELFCHPLETPKKEMRKLQRKLDRQRRATIHRTTTPAVRSRRERRTGRSRTATWIPKPNYLKSNAGQPPIGKACMVSW